MLIDINATFGGRESIQRFELETLDSQLERTPYSLAFIGSQEGTFDQRTSNQHVFDLCETRERWLQAGVLQPRDTFVWKPELERCLAQGVKLFRIYPDQSGWPVDSVLLDQLVERLAGRGVALLIEATQLGLPSRLVERTAASNVPLIFSEARYFPLTELIPLAQRYPNVFIETSRLTSPNGIQICVQELSAGRLLYGSGTCRYPAWIAWQMLQRASISREDREAIAWRNASRLLGLEPPVAHIPTAVERLATPTDSNEAGETGIPAVETWPDAIDIHLHDKFPGAPFRPFNPAAYAKELKRNRVIAGVSSSATAIFYDLKQGNDENERLLTAVPAIKGYVVVDPRYLDDSITELKRLDRSDLWIGVKIHCAHAKTATGSQKMKDLFAAIAKYGRPVLVHPLGEEWPEALTKLARLHPELPIVAAHAGYGDAPHPTHDAALRLADQPTIHIEFCSTYLATGAIRRGIEAVGVDRVLFGSDFPLISLEYMRVAYQDAELSAEEAAQIYAGNAIRLFPSLAAQQ